MSGLPPSGTTTFTVRVSKGNGDWLVAVSEVDGSEYAKTLASSLDVALQMAVPYMASVVGGPFDQLVNDLLDRAEKQP